MNKITFKIKEKPSKNSDHRNKTDIFVDGRNLIDLLREYELPFAEKEHHPDVAGRYTGLNNKILYERLSIPAEKVAILVCRECDNEDCWPMLVTIIENNDQIIWKDFHQIHRDIDNITNFWDYSKFPEFSFDKTEYYLELEKLNK